jgi:uncharacterized protein (DUF2252 family)
MTNWSNRHSVCQYIKKMLREREGTSGPRKLIVLLRPSGTSDRDSFLLVKQTVYNSLQLSVQLNGANEYAARYCFYL